MSNQLDLNRTADDADLIILACLRLPDAGGGPDARISVDALVRSPDPRSERNRAMMRSAVAAVLKVAEEVGVTPEDAVAEMRRQQEPPQITMESEDDLERIVLQPPNNSGNTPPHKRRKKPWRR